MTELHEVLERCVDDSGEAGLVRALLWALGPLGFASTAPRPTPLDAALARSRLPT